MMDAAGKRPDSLADSAPSDTFLAMISNDSPTDLGAMQDLWQTRPNGGSQQDLWARPSGSNGQHGAARLAPNGIGAKAPQAAPAAAAQQQLIMKKVAKRLL